MIPPDQVIGLTAGTTETSEEVESLKAKLGQLRNAEEQRRLLEDELEMMRVENEQLQERVDRFTGSSSNPNASGARGTRESTMNLHSVEVTELREIVRQTAQELDEVKQKYDDDITERDELVKNLRTEMEAAWQGVEDSQAKIENLIAALTEKDAKIQALESKEIELEQLKAQKGRDVEEEVRKSDRLEKDYCALEARSQEMEEEWRESERIRAELSDELAEVTEVKDQLENERNAVSTFDGGFDLKHTQEHISSNF